MQDSKEGKNFSVLPTSYQTMLLQWFAKYEIHVCVQGCLCVASARDALENAFSLDGAGGLGKGKQ